MNRDPSLVVASWGHGKNAARDVRQAEIPLEEKVSEYLGSMTLVFLAVPDAPGPDSAREAIKRGAIALLSNYNEPTPDRPSSDWLGHYSGRERVRQSGLWNNNHVDEAYAPAFAPAFLYLFDTLVELTPAV